MHTVIQSETSLSRLVKLLTAFTLIYVVWGSPYLAIQIAIKSIPPFLMTSIRFLIAGSLLFAWSLLRRPTWPTLRQWYGAAVVGALLYPLGSGALAWGEQIVPSGLAALIMTTIPFWMIFFSWLSPAKERPTGMTLLGIGLGFLGIIVLTTPLAIVESTNLDFFGTLILLLAAAAWSAGSVLSRYIKIPASISLATGMQMLAGGSMLLIVGIVAGELALFDPSKVGFNSTIALVYLILFCSTFAYSAYIWLIRVTTPTIVATHAFVNPIVALLLGVTIAGEPLTIDSLVAAVIILAGVYLVLKYQPKNALENPETA